MKKVYNVKSILLILGFVLMSASYSFSASVPNTFTGGTQISATAMNSNFSSLVNAVTTLEGKVAKLGTTIGSSSTYADYCSYTLNTFNECAPVTIYIPSGKTGRVTVTSIGNFPNTGTADLKVIMCVTARLSTATLPGSCSSVTTGAIVPGYNKMGSAGISHSFTLTAGTYIISTGVNPSAAIGIIPGFDYGKVFTTVSVEDAYATLGSFKPGDPSSEFSVVTTQPKSR